MEPTPEEPESSEESGSSESANDDDSDGIEGIEAQQSEEEPSAEEPIEEIAFWCFTADLRDTTICNRTRQGCIAQRAMYKENKTTECEFREQAWCSRGRRIDTMGYLDACFGTQTECDREIGYIARVRTEFDFSRCSKVPPPLAANGRQP